MRTKASLLGEWGGMCGRGARRASVLIAIACIGASIPGIAVSATQSARSEVLSKATLESLEVDGTLTHLVSAADVKNELGFTTDPSAEVDDLATDATVSSVYCGAPFPADGEDPTVGVGQVNYTATGTQVSVATATWEKVQQAKSYVDGLKQAAKACAPYTNSSKGLSVEPKPRAAPLVPGTVELDLAFTTPSGPLNYWNIAFRKGQLTTDLVVGTDARLGIGDKEIVAFTKLAQRRLDDAVARAQKANTKITKKAAAGPSLGDKCLDWGATQGGLECVSTSGTEQVWAAVKEPFVVVDVGAASNIGDTCTAADFGKATSLTSKTGPDFTCAQVGNNAYRWMLLQRS